MSRSVVAWRAAGVLLLAPGPGSAGEPAPPDTAVYRVGEVVVTALRGEDRLREIPAAAFVFTRDEIRQAGVARLSTLLRAVPGLYGYLQSSNGDVSVVDPRGFTANGESSYLRMLVNGQDVRDVENGNVDWDWLLPDDVERLEVVEGPATWLYGDGAEGGIVNIVRPAIGPGLRSGGAARFGSFGMGSGSVTLSGRGADVSGSLRGSIRRVDGWRARSREDVLGAGVEARWTIADTRLGVDAAWLDADREDPGALTPKRLAADRGQADTDTDFVHSRRLLLGARLAHGRPETSEWTLAPYFRTEDTDRTRTFFSNTLLAQTQIHPTEAWTAGAEVGWRRRLDLGERPLALMAGAQFERARLRSRYYDPDDGGRGALRSSGESSRTTLSAHVAALVELDERTSARLGFRQDGVRVRSEDRLSGERVPPRTPWSASPFASLTRRVGDRATVYANYAAAFRMPTLNQLFDRGPFDNPFTGGTNYISNRSLNPQRSHSVEAGGRIDAPGGSYALLTLYSVRVRDEIDFDAATLSYGNIGRSWHRGVQLAARRALGRYASFVASGAYAPTTIRGTEDDGNQINAVPLGTAYGALAWSDPGRWSLEGGVRYVGHQYLDKANAHRLSDFATVEAAGSVRLARVRVALRVGNVLDRDYVDSGYFVDLGPFSQERLYPAAGRSFSVSLSAD